MDKKEYTSVSDALKTKGRLVIVGCVVAKAKANGNLFAKLSTLSLMRGQGMGFDVAGCFCDPEVAAEYQGPGVYEVDWDVSMLGDRGAARLVSIALEKPVEVVLK